MTSTSQDDITNCTFARLIVQSGSTKEYVGNTIDCFYYFLPITICCCSKERNTVRRMTMEPCFLSTNGSKYPFVSLIGHHTVSIQTSTCAQSIIKIHCPLNDPSDSIVDLGGQLLFLLPPMYIYPRILCSRQRQKESLSMDFLANETWPTDYSLLQEYTRKEK